MLAWITDPHLNFIRDKIPEFACGVAEDTTIKEVVFTGDITEAPYIEIDIAAFVQGLNAVREGIGVYFILGNHDYYRGSFREAETRARRVQETFPEQLVYLSDTDHLPLRTNKHVRLVGQDGLYDARCGLKEQSSLQMNDFYLIEDFQDSPSMYGNSRPVPIEEIASRARKRAGQQAMLAKPKLEEAAQLSTHVLFATHYPPYLEACWHEGGISDAHWAPWFTSIAMGKMLDEVAKDYPSTQFKVLCGHTHSSGYYKRKKNLHVYTGASKYGAPFIHQKLGLQNAT